MKKRIHKVFIILSLIFALSALFCTLTACGSSRADRLSEQCLRIHIRANSDSQEDQQVKLAVRDALTNYLASALEGCRSKSDAVTAVRAHSDKILQIADSTLYAHDFTYKASICIKNEYFPDRNYDGYLFPAGNYDAVIISLGSGEGQNWWCVAFPPLCFVPAGDGEKVVYKSWIKEMLDKLFA